MDEQREPLVYVEGGGIRLWRKCPPNKFWSLVPDISYEDIPLVDTLDVECPVISTAFLIPRELYREIRETLPEKAWLGMLLQDGLRAITNYVGKNYGRIPFHINVIRLSVPPSEENPEVVEILVLYLLPSDVGVKDFDRGEDKTSCFDCPSKGKCPHFRE